MSVLLRRGPCGAPVPPHVEVACRSGPGGTSTRWAHSSVPLHWRTPGDAKPRSPTAPKSTQTGAVSIQFEIIS
ncbi:hypothetical protein EB796_023903 [Bugula neritina]|uniref:Uncharacterized protein n=1 Tax=Bugula neritina TaxID=10212 RepID=A0A7J7IVG4_BUGNE|nr:hypothetical protein EB796_023903 [Bugula neritina]